MKQIKFQFKGKSLKQSRVQRQRGVTLTETLLVLALAAILAAAAYRAYASASNDARTTELSNGTVALVGKIKQVWGADGDYSSLDAASLDRSGVLPPQLRTNGTQNTPATEIRDTFGNPVEVHGTSGSFTLKFGNLSKNSCSTLASSLAGLAYRIQVGVNANGADGTATGGSQYKGPEVSNVSGLDTDALVQACGSNLPAERVIVAEIR